MALLFFNWKGRVVFLSIFKLFSFIGAIAFAFFLFKKTVIEFTGSSRKKQQEKLIEDLKKSDKKITGPNTPRCPLCGCDTERYEYPHLRVWRCISFPECRGFVKADRGGARYARKWRNR